MKRDTLFTSTSTRASDFQFDKKVASVFFYREFQHMVVELTRELFPEGNRVYDLGCSTGTTLINLHEALQSKVQAYIGYDNSEAQSGRKG